MFLCDTETALSRYALNSIFVFCTVKQRRETQCSVKDGANRANFSACGRPVQILVESGGPSHTNYLECPPLNPGPISVPLWAEHLTSAVIPSCVSCSLSGSTVLLSLFNHNGSQKNNRIFHYPFMRYEPCLRNINWQRLTGDNPRNKEASSSASSPSKFHRIEETGAASGDGGRIQGDLRSLTPTQINPPVKFAPHVEKSCLVKDER